MENTRRKIRKGKLHKRECKNADKGKGGHQSVEIGCHNVSLLGCIVDLFHIQFSETQELS